MKRKLITCLLAMTMAAGLAACGSTKTSTTSDNTKQGSTTDDAASDTSDESTDDNDSTPSEITPETLKDFPVSKYVAYGDDGKGGAAAYYQGNLASERGDIEKVVVVPSEIIIGEYTTKIDSFGADYNPFITGIKSEIEAIVIPDSINSFDYLYNEADGFPKKLKYILLPTKFENTGLEDKWDPDYKLTWIYEDVTGQSYKAM